MNTADGADTAGAAGTARTPGAAEAVPAAAKSGGRALLALEGVVVRYTPDGPAVLEGIDLALAPGEVVGLIGPSGAGKSTLLRAIQQLVPVAAGHIRLGALELTGLRGAELRKARRRIGMIFQDHALVDRLTVMENILSGALGRVGFWAAWRRRFPGDDVEEAFRLLGRVGLEGLENRRCDALSGGQRQRVGIARALLQQPEVLLVDEPTASLDPATAGRVMTLITELCAERGLAAIINLHDVPLARRFCPRVIALRGGALVYDGAPGGLDDAVLATVYGDEAAS